MDEPEATKLTVWRVVLIAALVGFCVGSIPALATALVISHDFKKESTLRAYQNCSTFRDGRIVGNERSRQNRLNLQADADVYTTVLKFTPRKVQPGSKITQAQLDTYLAKLKNAVRVKQQKIIPLTTPLAIPNCEKDFPVDKSERIAPVKLNAVTDK